MLNVGDDENLSLFNPSTLNEMIRFSSIREWVQNDKSQVVLRSLIPFSHPLSPPHPPLLFRWIIRVFLEWFHRFFTEDVSKTTPCVRVLVPMKFCKYYVSAIVYRMWYKYIRKNIQDERYMYFINIKYIFIIKKKKPLSGLRIPAKALST